jgi:uncharacterized protein YlxP (DUF503 family)
MFVCVARVTLQIPDSGSLKAKRQVLRRITDRVKARFNASVAEVDDQELWQKAQLAVAVVSADKRHAQEQVDKILHFIDELYVAPVTAREVELLSFGEDLYGGPRAGGGAGLDPEAPVDLDALLRPGDRSLAEAEGLGQWHERHEAAVGKAARSGKSGKGGALDSEDVRARARALRNPRDWEKK